MVTILASRFRRLPLGFLISEPATGAESFRGIPQYPKANCQKKKRKVREEIKNCLTQIINFLN
jgi:hypothetical protein